MTITKIMLVFESEGQKDAFLGQVSDGAMEDIVYSIHPIDDKPFNQSEVFEVKIDPQYESKS